MAQAATLSNEPFDLNAFTKLFARGEYALGLGVMALVMMLIIPIPPFLLDFLLAISITLSVLILMTALLIKKPLEFSAFPTVLLLATLLRLALNIATTRLILAHGHEGPEAAGSIIQVFGGFVMGGNFVIGVVVFIILIIVNFIVVTKGSGRIAEVAARFTLDAMPGKQMAVDADLSAGLINEDEARRRRKELEGESNFFGAMDGASKFVRGDAIAGILITIINVVGGFAIAKFQLGWSAADAMKTFMLLTIGDGLVSQLPAFLVAIASGLIVARAGGGKTVGEEIPNQLASQPMALYLIGGFLILLSFTPLPTFPLMTAGILLGVTAYAIQWKKRKEGSIAEANARGEASRKPVEQPKVEELLTVDTLELEIGYAVVGLVDASRGGDLLDRIAGIRRHLAVELGLVMPSVRIRDNMQLDPNDYRVKIRGAVVASGKIYPDLLMAMDSGLAHGRLEGMATKEPAFGLDAIWITRGLREKAENSNWTVGQDPQAGGGARARHRQAERSAEDPAGAVARAGGDPRPRDHHRNAGGVDPAHQGPRCLGGVCPQRPAPIDLHAVHRNRRPWSAAPALRDHGSGVGRHHFWLHRPQRVGHDLHDSAATGHPYRAGSRGVGASVGRSRSTGGGARVALGSRAGPADPRAAHCGGSGPRVQRSSTRNRS